MASGLFGSDVIIVVGPINGPAALKYGVYVLPTWVLAPGIPVKYAVGVACEKTKRKQTLHVDVIIRAQYYYYHSCGHARVSGRPISARAGCRPVGVASVFGEN